MSDIFQFYSGSADAAPGKGAGETLASTTNYSALRKISGWRRSLAAGEKEKLDEILPLTGTAELWEAPLKKPKVRREDLETKRRELTRGFDSIRLEDGIEEKSSGLRPKGERGELKTLELAQPKEVKEQPQQQMEAPAVAPKKSKAQELLEKKRAAEAAKAADAAAAAASEAAVKTASEAAAVEAKEANEDEIVFAAQEPEEAPEVPPAKPSAPASEEKAKTKRTKKTATIAPEVVLAEPDKPLTPVDVERPDMEKEEKTSIMRFCPIDGYYLFLQVSSTKERIETKGEKDLAHYRLCRNCGYKEQDEKGGLLSEILVQEKSAEGYKILLNEHTRKDPRLPHLRGVIKCPDAGCASNKGGQESDIIYMKYDAVNLMYLYICDICGFEWRSRR